ncbi:MAG TPA: glutamate-5-semialdehyde dehydrogenase [Arenibacter sp.]|nr:glutamate-5-semialdehyde dehydrogenase [Arenibacter sp.]
MSLYLNLTERNAVLTTMAQLLDGEREVILNANKRDLEAYKGNDLAMHDRLKVDGEKIDGMILSLRQLAGEEDPLGQERFQFVHENGMQVSNRTAPFGTVLIIYESRPDVTIEAAAIAFKSGNHILLKGGKESLQSNLVLVDFWHRSLEKHGISREWVSYLQFNREETQAFLEHPTQKLDLIVPRGGEKLIAFVKKHATCPVIVSGRGNNFLYVHPKADQKMALQIILNAKTAKISACNALDKVLIDAALPNKTAFVTDLIGQLKQQKVEVLVDESLGGLENTSMITGDSTWFEEFLDYKILLGEVQNPEEAIQKINTYGGGHSAVIVTGEEDTATFFMNAVDAAAVYHNASSRFTDGGQFGLGGELAISTDKLHQRGPIGLQHLVTNKWHIKGGGQIR